MEWRGLYWILKEEIENRKMSSSSAVSEMIQITGKYFKNQVIEEIRSAKVCSSEVDETTDISTAQHFFLLYMFLVARCMKND